MPCLEESPQPLQVDPTSDNEPQQPGAQEQTPQPARELTQTDMLNKRLLKSFLDRLNDSKFMSKFSSPSNENQPANEFDD